MKKKLYRSRTDRMIAGVLGGLAEYLNVDSTWVRLIFAIILVFSVGSLSLLYILCWIIIPLAPIVDKKVIIDVDVEDVDEDK